MFAGQPPLDLHHAVYRLLEDRGSETKGECQEYLLPDYLWFNSLEDNLCYLYLSSIMWFQLGKVTASFVLVLE